MFRIVRRKRVLVSLSLIGALAIAGAAFAYFTSTGSGSGNTQAGTSTALTITAAITPGTGGIVPGGNPADVAFSVNNTGSGKEYVGTVSLTGVQAYSDAAHNNDITGTGAGQCDTTQFTMASVTEGQSISSGTTALTSHGNLSFRDSGTNQDGCKSAYLVASFSSN
jgi:hypothetical protein